MKRKVYRNEVQSTVVNLLDLGFTVAAISFMLNKNPVTIYGHLKRADRMTGRVFHRYAPACITAGAQAALRRIHAEPRWINTDLLAATLTGATPPASGMKRTSGKSGKKAA